jgi:hypothetical protein
MRVLILALMIALLPLRGWMGDVMATEMQTAAGPSNAIKNIASSAYSTRARGQFVINSKTIHEPCHGQNDAPVDWAASTVAPHDHAAQHHGSNCNACQICSAVATSAAVRFDVDCALSHLLRPTGGTQFVSAPAVPGLKPPIS